MGTRTVRIDRSLTELPGGGYLFGPPKSDAGQRIVVFPDLITQDLAWHLARFSAPGDEALVFTGPTGSPLRHGNFRSRVWLAALETAGLPAIHFHDSRHTGNHLTEAGATLRELMERMGHSTTRAALIYLHATDERQRAVPDAVDVAARTALGKAITGRNREASGTDLARRGNGAV